LDDVRGIVPDAPAIGQLAALFGYLDAYGMTSFAEFDIGVVRGLAYYTGIVFEVFDKQRTMRAIAGGGRYDHLVAAAYGGPDTPAVGFAAGDVVLGELLRAKFGTPASPPRADVFVVAIGQESIARAIRLATTIRGAGISCEFALKETGVGKQFKLADAARARVAVIEGDDERAAGVVKIKDMGSGEESTVAAGEIVKKIRGMIG
jgi:histidyl-tRNA synthetase